MLYSGMLRVNGFGCVTACIVVSIRHWSLGCVQVLRMLDECLGEAGIDRSHVTEVSLMINTVQSVGDLQRVRVHALQPADSVMFPIDPCLCVPASLVFGAMSATAFHGLLAGFAHHVQRYEIAWQWCNSF